MNWRLRLLQLHLPKPLMQRQLLELHRRAASAFGCIRARDGCTAAGSCRRRLERLAEFTRDQAQSALSSGVDLEALSERLRREGEAMGCSLRKKLRLRSRRDFHTALRLVYRALGIDLRVYEPGQVLIRKCLFSRFYTAPVCRLMSALDDGLASGLSGGYRLRFTHHLTEGSPCCRAVIEWPGRQEGSVDTAETQRAQRTRLLTLGNGRGKVAETLEKNRPESGR